VAGVEIRVLGRFELLIDGLPIGLPVSSQRVLGCLAVLDPTQRRDLLAGRLWGDSSQDRALSSLRDALWRIRKAARGLVQTSRDLVRLNESVLIDLSRSERLARLVLGDPGSHLPSDDAARRLLEQDLLPAWDDEWITLERERLHQLRIHALEAVSRSLTRSGHFAQAIEAALTAIDGEPLRESAHAALIEAHMAEGNLGEAIRALETYRSLLGNELGLAPTERIESLVPVHRP
jgi:DNA-binding SARP family transcriptional activator